MPGFVLQTAPIPSELAASCHPPVGFTVSRKVGNAVVRNRVRRRLREIARQVIPQAGPRRPRLTYRMGRQERARAATCLRCAQQLQSRRFAAV